MFWLYIYTGYFTVAVRCAFHVRVAVSEGSYVDLSAVMTRKRTSSYK